MVTVSAGPGLGSEHPVAGNVPVFILFTGDASKTSVQKNAEMKIAIMILDFMVFTV
jgi:hypothetical protein